MIIGVVLLIVVGPTRLPKLLKAAVSSYREFRRATRELRASTGIDEILQDEDLKDLRKPLKIDVPGAGTPAGSVAAKQGGARKRALSFTERVQENPPEGVDLAEIRDAETRPTKEERDAIRAAKEAKFQKEEAIKAAKVATAESQARIEAGASEGDEEISEGDQAIINAKLAAASEASDEEISEGDQAIINAKLAAAEAEEEAATESEAASAEA